MVVSIIFDTEYTGMGERIKWFLKNISYVEEQDYFIITHEYIKSHLEELMTNCSSRFYNEFEMKYVPKERIESMHICYVPDVFFENNEEFQPRTSTLMQLETTRHLELEKFIISAIEDELSLCQEKKPEYIMNCLHVFESVRYIGSYFNCPIIPYSFSAIRKVHGYAATLYMAHMDSKFFCSRVAEKLYADYKKCSGEITILTKREILALIGKRHNLILLPLLNITGNHEVGIVPSAFRVVPPLFNNIAISDDDLFYECQKYYKSDQITTRLHPKILRQAGLGTSHMKDDPVTFLLDCKKIVSIQSQIIVKAAMWNRVPCALGGAMPFGFLLHNDIHADTPISDLDLNYILFCYFVPDKCMFDHTYWAWRFENPSLSDIVNRHLSVILETYGLDMSFLDAEDRFERILALRGCNQEEIATILNFDASEKTVDMRCPSSKIIVEQDDISEERYSLNVIEGDCNCSTFHFASEKTATVRGYLLDDIDGNIQIEQIYINGCSISENNAWKYTKKREESFCLELEANEYHMKVYWRYRPTFE